MSTDHLRVLNRNYISGQKRSITTRKLERNLKRCQTIELVIGPLKSDGLLGRNYIKGMLSDQMNVLLCCASYNLRLVLKRLKFLSGIFSANLAVSTVFTEFRLSNWRVQIR